MMGIVWRRNHSRSYELLSSVASFEELPLRLLFCHNSDQKLSAATGIIYGLALGYLSTIIPVVSQGITILVAHSLCGMFGVALGALVMLGTLTMGLTTDAFGPISDNAGGIAEMSQLDEWVRERTDVLDAADNIMAAIGKGFAIGSAALVSLALFGAFCVRADITGVDILHPWVFTGLLFGAMMSYAFAALTMKFVGKAANEMVRVPRQQLMGCDTANSTCNGGMMTSLSLRRMARARRPVTATPQQWRHLAKQRG